MRHRLHFLPWHNFRQHKYDCDSTMVESAGVCPFASLEDGVYDPSAQALRNLNLQRCVKATVIGSSSIACASRSCSASDAQHQSSALIPSTPAALFLRNPMRAEATSVVIMGSLRWSEELPRI